MESLINHVHEYRETLSKVDARRPLHVQTATDSISCKNDFEEKPNVSGIRKKTNGNLSPRGGDTQSDVSDIIELRKRLYDSSKSLVAEGGKHVSIALDLEKTKDALREMRAENHQIRLILLGGINGGISDVENFSNIPLSELLRIRLQEIERDGTDSISLNPSFSWSKKQSKGSLNNSSGQHKIDSRRTSVQEPADDSSTSVNRLKKTIDKMNDRSRRERETKQKAHKDLTEANKKVEALSDHIEKLMVHLKHEAITKAKVLSERGRHTKEIENLKKRNQILENKNARKDRLIGDLKEGGKLLEDQLSLMDEKYMELRMKLDWTRTQTEKILKKKDEEVKDLRLQNLIADKKAKVSNFLEDILNKVMIKRLILLTGFFFRNLNSQIGNLLVFQKSILSQRAQ